MAKRQIVRPPGPEELDQLVRVSAPVAWLAFWFLAVSMAGVVVWSFYSTAPVKITAQGIILAKTGVAEVSATSQGQIASLEFKVGDQIQKGDPVAEIVQPSIAESIASKNAELEQLLAKKQQIAEFQQTTAASQSALLEQNERSIRQRIETLEKTLVINQDSEKTMRGLLDRGITTRPRYLAARSEMLETESQLNDARSELAAVMSDRAKLSTADARELLGLDLDIARVQTDLTTLRTEADRRREIVSDVTGTVAEVSVRSGDIVSVGQAILRVVSLPSDQADQELVARLYANSSDGKKLRPGMPVQIVPATARLERDSYLVGRVLEVSLIPATRESIQATLRNNSLVDVMTRDGPPFEVVVELIRDDRTVSKYAWSNGIGLDKQVESGTLLHAKVIVDRIPIIALVIPRAETVLAEIGFTGSGL
ncbi:MAG: NHLP bacteriocin system secretion protein [Hoeflea sp.]|uniref:NHLP bacteriocin system secretion protein n=1 Tax=Hoeflea sp. TaxID=1940281 RepID=UPI003299CDBC